MFAVVIMICDEAGLGIPIVDPIIKKGLTSRFPLVLT